MLSACMDPQRHKFELEKSIDKKVELQGGLDFKAPNCFGENMHKLVPPEVVLPEVVLPEVVPLELPIQMKIFHWLGSLFQFLLEIF